MRAKPADMPYTLKDGAGLFVNVKPNGTKSWLFRFYWLGVQKRLSLGIYPTIDIKKARSLRQAAQDLLDNGIDPRQSRKKTNSMQMTETMLSVNQSHSVTFAEYAQYWKAFKLKKLGAEYQTGRQSTRIQIERYLRKDMLPVLGNKPMDTISRADVLAVQRNIEARGALSIAEKCRSWLNELFRHAQGCWFL